MPRARPATAKAITAVKPSMTPSRASSTSLALLKKAAVKDPTKIMWTRKILGSVPGAYAEADKVLVVQRPQLNEIVATMWESRDSFLETKTATKKATKKNDSDGATNTMSHLNWIMSLADSPINEQRCLCIDLCLKLVKESRTANRRQTKEEKKGGGAASSPQTTTENTPRLVLEQVLDKWEVLCRNWTDVDRAAPSIVGSILLDEWKAKNPNHSSGDATLKSKADQLRLTQHLKILHDASIVQPKPRPPNPKTATKEELKQSTAPGGTYRGVDDTLWRRRLAIIALLPWVKVGFHRDALAICTRLKNDPHDLMHKACGWTLREVGRNNMAVLQQYLEEHAATMPRVALRYAVEHMNEKERKTFYDKKQK